MIIHENNVFFDSKADRWCYYLDNVGSDNEAYIFFDAPPRAEPRTGDMIVNNKLVKGGEK